ncbi:MAG: fibronectin type III domain-containing protein [Clostridia bacterium]|nr:fibronectin type III domain-containing protein [Clostridia bacterium]
MFSKSFKRVLGAVLSASMLLSTAAVSFAAEGVNVVDISSYLYDAETDTVAADAVETVFVGETVKTILGFENMGSYSGFQIGIIYDNSKIQLAPLADSATILDAYDFEAEEVGITVSDYGKTAVKKIKSYALPNLGIILSAREQKDASLIPVTDLTEVVTMEFKAIKAGTSGFKYVNPSVDGDNIYDAANEDIGYNNEDYCKFPGLEVVMRTNNFTILDKPDTPTDVAWGEEDTENEFTVSWTAPATGDRGYTVNVYVDDAETPSETIDTTETSIDLIDVIEKYAVADYHVSVVAKGGDNDSDESEKASKTVTEIPLKLENVAFDEDTKTLSWSEVEHADSYVITVTKDGVTDPIDTITVNDPTVVTVDLSDKIGVGDYTITIVASSESELYGTATKTENYSSGSTITGNVKPVLHSAASITPSTTHKTKVTLTGASGTYAAECDADGNFVIAGVPADADGYTVTIERVSTVTRTFSDKLVLTKSVEKNICADGMSLTVYVGDIEKIRTENQIEIDDNSLILTMVGSMSEDAEYSADADVSGDDETITTRDASVILYNFWKGQRSYRNLNDYNFTIGE